MSHYLFGEIVRQSEPLDAEQLGEVIERARIAQERLAEVPLLEIVELLDRLSRLWARPRFDGRKLALEHLPGLVGFSPQMVEQGLETLVQLLARPNLLAKLRYELGQPEALDRWIWRPGYQGYVRAAPLGVVVHISPGNVFLGAVDSLVHGLLTKNANILKAASVDPFFPLLFARSLKQLDPSGQVAGSFAVVSFDGHDPALQKVVKEKADGLLVWGGAKALEAWSGGLAPGLRLVGYGPRLSLALVTFAYLERVGVEEAAKRLARDVVMWEQRACGSPQSLFLQLPDPGPQEDRVQSFLAALGQHLDELAQEFPQPELSRDEEIELLKEREIASFGQLVGDSFERHGATWSLLWRNSLDRLGSPLNRCLSIHPFTRLAEVAEALRPYKAVLQSLGVGALSVELREVANRLAPLGVTRFTELGRMHTGKMGSPHDGTFQLAQLLRWSSIESAPERFDVGRRLDPTPARSEKSERLLNLLEYARDRSPFYHERLKEIELDQPGALLEIPLLTGAEIRANTPPVGQGLLTGPFEGAYVFASGGSTGAPKFSLYTYEEWNEVTDILASVYEVAGLSSSDVVANLFMAGNLWTSFLAASEALGKIGGVTLPIAGNAELALVMRYLDMFRPTAMVGLPSVLIQIAETAERQGLQLKIPRILYGGEHLYREAREYLGRVLGAETVLSAGYASVDGGPIGYQCPHLTGGVHHLLYHSQYLELLDPASGRPVEPGEVGEVVITCLNRRLLPLIRYRTGDMARQVEHDCACGRRTPLFELKGRADDVVRVGTVSVYPEDVAAALDAVSGLSHLFQLVATREGAADSLTVKVESASDGAELASRARESLLSRSGELEEALREGWLRRLEVELLPPGELPRIPRTGKIRRVVDQRA
ncbi:aldehyde dehydrogenase family protein [bacterium CPR1]|nr:aldehyde dehydrogenase family protein [bacterium CPR1]